MLNEKKILLFVFFIHFVLVALLAVRLPDFGPWECVDLGKVLEDEDAGGGHGQVQGYALVILYQYVSVNYTSILHNPNSNAAIKQQKKSAKYGKN